jgi:hypothetical protein
VLDKLATNAPHEKPNRKFKVCQFDAPRGTPMRRESRPTNEGVETIAYRFHFQMAKDGARQACSVEVEASNIHDATTFFWQNWPMIESIARDGLLNRFGADRTINPASRATETMSAPSRSGAETGSYASHTKRT